MIQMVKPMDEWQDIRNTRYKFAHDYPDDWEKNAALNVDCEAAADMYKILTGIEKKLKIDQPVFELGKSLSVTSFEWNGLVVRQ